MTQGRPDQSFCPSPRSAMEAPAEQVAYVAMIDASRGRPDAMAVVDDDPASAKYAQIVGQDDMPNAGDELHHFGWKACSSCLCPQAPHPHREHAYLFLHVQRA